jgi:CsoR family transcriptional regulator, copper-sensing transcriptional repressor
MATQKKARKRPGPGYVGERDDLLRRLRRIEGQVRGIQQMLTEDRECVDVVQQVNAVVAASREVSARILGTHLHHCSAVASGRRDGEEAIGEMVGVIRQMLKA